MDPTLERSFRGHKNAISSLAFHPSGKQLASGGLDSNVICYHMKPGMRSFQFIGHKGAVYSVNYHPTGQLLASASADHSVKLWTPTVKGDVSTFKAHSGPVRSVEFSSTGHYLLTASDDKSIKVWSTHKGRFQMTLTGHMNWVRSAHFSPDDKMAVSGSDDKTVKLWDLATKTCVKTYMEHTGIIVSTQFHPSGHLIAACSSDRSIKVWDIRTHKLLQHYGNAHGPAEGTAGLVNSISFGGQAGEWLISTGGDGLVKIWDLQEGHLFYTLYGHKTAPTTAACFSRDRFGGKYFASASADAQLLVWKANFNLIDPEAEGNALSSALPASNQITSQFKSTSKSADNQQEPISIAEEFNLKSNATAKPPVNQVGMDIDAGVTTAPLNPVHSTLPAMATALSQLANQMAALTQTMSWMEDRISGIEDRIIAAAEKKNSAQQQ